MNFEIIAIIAANLLLTKKALDDPYFMNKYKFNVGAVQSGEKYRLFSSAFLHVDWTHFFFNMLTLWFFAPMVMMYLGKVSFLLVYFGSLVLGNYAALLIHKNDRYYSAVGASGAVMGVIYASILLAPHNKIYMFFVLGLPAYIFGLLYLLYSIYGMKKQNDGIGHAAHFGGAIGGFISIVVLNFNSIIDHFWVSILLLLPMIYLFYLIKNNKL